MAYFEGEIPVVSTGNNNNGSMWGGDSIWAILLLALFGYGRGFGGGYGGGYGSGGNEVLGYELGKVATTNDVANGFAQNTLQRGIDDILLASTQGFAGLNTAIANATSTTNYNMLQGFHGVDNAICNLGYNLTHQISDCCCQTQRAIDGVNYNMATNTGQIVQAINCGNQKIIDYMQAEKIDTLNRKLAVAEGQISQANQTATLLNAINRTPVPAYSVPNPYCCYNTCGCNNTGII
jgi:hypothetical protein